MADARALLRAKRQEARIDHPLAAYTSSGQLRCLACGTAVKHAAAWEGHIGSKAHRTSAARLRDERARENLKRKAAEQDENSDGGQDEAAAAAGAEAGVGGDDGAIATQGHAKRQRTAESAEEPQPRPAAAAPAHGNARSALPADFFSDPSQAPAVPEVDSDADEEMEEATDKDKPKDARGEHEGPDTLDLEWQQFQASVVNAPDVRETYERATVFAEPVLAAEVPQGFPGSAMGTGEDVAGADAEGAGELDEEGQRRKKEQEERELIMDRLLEEEQAQEEADARVVQLKTKLEALRQKREAARSAKKGARAS